VTLRSERLTLAVLCLAVGSYSLLQSMTIPTLPLIEHELRTDQTTVSWVLTAFLLAASVATPIVGRYGDSYGKRRLLVFSLVVLSIGSLAAAAATNIGVMIAARVLQGIGGGVLPLAFGIVRDEIPSRRVAGAIGLISSVLALGSGAGIVVAGPIVDALGYHALFLLPAVVAACAVAVTVVAIPESPTRSFERVSVVPALALGGWLVPLIVALTKAPQWGWQSPRVAGLFGGAIVAFVLWIIAERRAAIPLLDLRMLRIRAVWTSNLVALLTGAALYSSFGFLPQFNQTPRMNGYGFGATVTEAGHMMLPGTICAFVMGLLGARIAERIGSRTTIFLGSVTTSLALWMAAFAHAQKWEVYVVSGLTGVGAGLAFACLSNVVVAAVPASQTGVATGMNANLRTVGGSFGVAILTSLVAVDTTSSGFPAESGYTRGFAVLAMLSLVAGFCALLIPRSPLRDRPTELRAARIGSEWEGLVEGAQAVAVATGVAVSANPCGCNKERTAHCPGDQAHVDVRGAASPLA
jgi:MFS family permease